MQFQHKDQVHPKFFTTVETKNSCLIGAIQTHAYRTGVLHSMYIELKDRRLKHYFLFLFKQYIFVFVFVFKCIILSCNKLFSL